MRLGRELILNTVTSRVPSPGATLFVKDNRSGSSNLCSVLFVLDGSTAGRTSDTSACVDSADS